MSLINVVRASCVSNVYAKGISNPMGKSAAACRSIHCGQKNQNQIRLTED